MSQSWPVQLQWLWGMGVGLGILASAVGWRSVPLRYARWREESWAVAGTVGMAVMVILGGWMNALRLVSPAACIALLPIGWLLLLLRGRGQAPAPPTAVAGGIRSPRGMRLLWAVAIVLLVVHYAGWAWNTDFDPHDDFHAYLAFPHRMLETGWMGNEPFGHRRVVAVFGGMSFLHAIVLSLCTEPSVHLIDPGLPYLLLAGLIGDTVRRFRLSPVVTPLLVIAVTLTAIPRLNISCLLLGVCLFAVLFLWIVERSLDPEPNPGEWMLLAALAAAAFSLKHNLTPGMGALLISLPILRAWRLHRPLKRVREAAVFTAWLVLLFGPWMWVSWRWSGTAWFPWLGRGVDVSAQTREFTLEAGITPALAGWSFMRFLMVPAIVAFTAALVLHALRRRSRRSDGLLVAGFACLVAAALAVVSTGGYSPNRLTFVFIYPGLLVAVLVGLRDGMSDSDSDTTGIRSWIRPERAAWFLLLLPLVPMLPNKFVEFNRPHAGFPAILSNTPYDGPERRTAYGRLTSVLPPGAQALACLDRNYLLRFTGERVWIADYPGNAGPSPGMPFSGDADETERYLVASGVTHLLYSHAGQGGLGPYLPGLRSSQFALVRQQAGRGIPWIAAFDALMRSRPRLHDDGSNAVIVLDARPAR